MSFLCFSGVNSVEFMSVVKNQTKALEQAIRDLRTEMTSPARSQEVDQEAIVLSGLNQAAEESLGHIKGLYEETRDLKEELDKVRGQ